MILWMIVSYMISLLFYAMWHSTHVLASPADYSIYTFSNSWGFDMKKDDEVTGEIVDLTAWREDREKEKMREELNELWKEFVDVTDQLAAYGDVGALKSSILDPIVDIRHQIRCEDDVWEWDNYDQFDEESDREPDY